jgi:hypothetical protein
VSLARRWKRWNELRSELADPLRHAVPRALRIAELADRCWRFAPNLIPGRLALYWYRWRILYWGDWDRPGMHFDLAGRLIETPIGPVDDPPAALVI